MARLEFDCDTSGCGNVIHTEVPIGEEMHRECRCTNCGAVFHARAVVYKEEGTMLGRAPEPEEEGHEEEPEEEGHEEEPEEEGHEEEPEEEGHEEGNQFGRLLGDEPVPA